MNINITKDDHPSLHTYDKMLLVGSFLIITKQPLQIKNQVKSLHCDCGSSEHSQEANFCSVCGVPLKQLDLVETKTNTITRLEIDQISALGTGEPSSTYWVQGDTVCFVYDRLVWAKIDIELSGYDPDWVIKSEMGVPIGDYGYAIDPTNKPDIPQKLISYLDEHPDFSYYDLQGIILVWS